MKHTPRKLSENILFALKNHPVVFLNGARQAGKSTLVHKLARGQYPAEYVSFDNATQMAAASVSPESFKRPQGMTLYAESSYIQAKKSFLLVRNYLLCHLAPCGNNYTNPNPCATASQVRLATERARAAPSSNVWLI